MHNVPTAVMDCTPDALSMGPRPGDDVEASEGGNGNGGDGRSQMMGYERIEDRFIGRVLANRYKVQRRLGVGGFGAVYQGEDTKIGKRVAVKVLSQDLVGDSAAVARFRKEAEAASKVGHEHIIDITDFDRTSDSHYFLVMEYLEGTDLGSVLRNGERLTLARILGIMIQVCRALNAAHNKGIIHRDLKPGNIFLTARGSRIDFVKLLDFGITKFMEMDDQSSRLTKTGQIIGTPLYMAPEQALGEEDLDHRVDVYSLGVILYELVTGQPPFTAVNYLGIIAQHASDPPTPPSKIRPDLEIPRDLELIILKALSKRPEERFSTMAEMEAALIHCLASIDPASAVTYSPETTPPSILTATTAVSQRRLSSFRPLPLLSLVVLAVAVGLGISLWIGRSGKEHASLPGPGMARPARVGASLSRKAAKRATRPDAGLPAALPRTATMRIDSTPSRADVVDERGNVLGRTPLELKLKLSQQPVMLVIKMAGYRAAKLTLVPTEDQVHKVPLKKRYTGGGLPDEPKGWGER